VVRDFRSLSALLGDVRRLPILVEIGVEELLLPLVAA